MRDARGIGGRRVGHWAGTSEVVRRKSRSNGTKQGKLTLHSFMTYHDNRFGIRRVGTQICL